MPGWLKKVLNLLLSGLQKGKDAGLFNKDGSPVEKGNFKK